MPLLLFPCRQCAPLTALLRRIIPLAGNLNSLGLMVDSAEQAFADDNVSVLEGLLRRHSFGTECLILDFQQL